MTTHLAAGPGSDLPHSWHLGSELVPRVGYLMGFLLQSLTIRQMLIYHLKIHFNQAVLLQYDHLATLTGMHGNGTVYHKISNIGAPNK